MRALRTAGYDQLILRGKSELDLTDQATTRGFFQSERPDCVILAAARVGGILTNWEHPYEFVQENLAIELNVIHEAFRSGVKRVLFLGSSCIYPREAPQPIKEEHLLTGPLEETNRPYALAKIAGIEMCRSLNRQYGTDYLSLMPTNLYGPGDNFDLHTSHVLPAMIRRIHEAKLGLPDEKGLPRNAQSDVRLWGTGRPYRELMHVDDMAAATLFLLENAHADQFPDGLVNVGTGADQTIGNTARLVQKVVGHTGQILWDETRPDGTPRKLLDVSRLVSLGWHARIGLEEGVRTTYEWFLENHA